MLVLVYFKIKNVYQHIKNLLFLLYKMFCIQELVFYKTVTKVVRSKN